MVGRATALDSARRPAAEGGQKKLFHFGLVGHP
jgi:hypothetical protein